MIDNTELPKLLRYVAGESSPEEVNEIRARLERDPEFRAEVAAWQRVRDARPPAWNTEQALATVQRELGFGERERRPVRLVPFPKRRIPVKQRVAVYAFRVAAVLLAGVGVAAVWRMGWAPRAGDHAAGNAVAIAFNEYVVPRGQRANIRLPDGTQVMLAAESRLAVPREFGRRGARREVKLQGQGYFDVIHDATRPFVVRTATSVTEDIGTAFTVRAYPEEPEVEVVVAHGVVAIQPAEAGLRDSVRQVLVPGQLARLDAKGELRTERGVNLARYLAWTKGSLAFDGVPFRRAAADVARWYDLDIQLDKPALGARRISGMVDGESADVVLGYLALVLDARYERRGRTVTFYARQAAS